MRTTRQSSRARNVSKWLLDALIIQDISAGVHGRVEVHSYQDPFIIKYDVIHCEIILQLGSSR